MDDRNGRDDSGDQHPFQSGRMREDPGEAYNGDPLLHLHDDVGNLIGVYQTAPDGFSGPAYVELCLFVAGQDQNLNAKTISSELTYSDFGAQAVTRIPSTTALEIEEGKNYETEHGWRKKPAKYHIRYLQYRRSLQRVEEWALDRSTVAVLMEEIMPEWEEIPMYARMDEQVEGWLKAQRGDAVTHALLVENCRARTVGASLPLTFPRAQVEVSEFGDFQVTTGENPTAGEPPLVRRGNANEERVGDTTEQKVASRARNKADGTSKVAAKPKREDPSRSRRDGQVGPSGFLWTPGGTSPTSRLRDDLFDSCFPHMGLQDTISEWLQEVAEDGKITLLEPSEADSGPSEGGNPEKKGSENNVRRGGSENNVWKWRPGDLKRRTCDRSTRQAIFDHVPAAEDDDILFRYLVYRFWSGFTDDYMELPVLPESACDWIACYENETAIDVIEHIQKRLGLEFLPHIPKRRCRLIKEDGLPEELRQVVDEDMSTPPSDYDDRVYLLSGVPYTGKKVTKRREEISEGLEKERHKAPSVGAQKTFELLNFEGGQGLRPSRLTSKMKDHLDEAYTYVREMDIDPDTSKQDDESWVEWQRRKNKQERDQRQEYFNALSAIADQHQPFYTFSNTGRTDRVFGYNKGVLTLPKEVRAILCQDFVEVDLKSAHLLIAAWLWDADEALETLSDEEYSIWDDLMEHYKPLFEENGHKVPEKGDGLYGAVKAALKVAVYSTVYGMDEIAIKGRVTKSLGDILGDEAGKHLDDHPIIAELLERRDEKLREMEVGDVLHGPTGIRIEIEEGPDENGDGVDPKSAMATLAQSYEQAAMQIILELERDRQLSDSRNYFRTALWLHDGAFVDLRYENARVEDLNERLERRCEELAEHAGKDTPMPAFFDVEAIELPESSDQSQEEETGVDRDARYHAEGRIVQCTVELLKEMHSGIDRAPSPSPDPDTEKDRLGPAGTRRRRRRTDEDDEKSEAHKKALEEYRTMRSPRRDKSPPTGDRTG